MENLTNKQRGNEEVKFDVYQAPSIEVVEVEIEQGFQASGPSRGEPSW